MQSKTAIIVLMIALLFSFSCVDEKYDLGNINGDMNLFQYAQIPIGATKNINLDDLFKGIEEIKANKQGRYYALYASSATIHLPDESEIKINPVNVKFDTPLQITNQDGITPIDMESTTTDVTEFELDYTEDSSLKELYEADLNTENGYSNVEVDILFQGLQVRSGEATAEIKVVLPKTFKLEQNNIFLTTIDLAKTNEAYYNLLLNRIGKSDDPEDPSLCSAENTTTIKIKQGADIWINNPKVIITLKIDDIHFNTVYGKFDIHKDAQTDINLSNFYDFMDDDPDNRFSFEEPRLFVTTNSNIGTKLNASLRFTTYKNGYEQMTTMADVIIPPTQQPFTFKKNNFGFGPVPLPGWGGISEQPWESEFELAEMLEGMPGNMEAAIETYITPQECDPQTSFLTKDLDMIVDYHFEIPFILANDFRMVFKDTLRDVFADEDLRKTLFTENVNSSVKDSIIFYGEVKTSIPLNLTMKLIPLDESYSEITGVNLGEQSISPSPDGITVKESTVQFILNRSDYSAMRNAVHFKALFIADTDEKSNVSITNKQTIKAELKMKKWGGITITQ